MRFCQPKTARPYPDGLNSKIPIHEHTEKGGRPPLGRARKQEYRITLRCNTSCNFKLRALTRAAGIPSPQREVVERKRRMEARSRKIG